jgi:hypothetical protein
MRNHAKVISQVLSSVKTKCIIAGDDDNFTINAFMVYELNPIVIHYAYVREAFRGLGFLKIMLAELPMQENKVEVTHWTKKIDDYFFKYKNFIYNPYPFFCEVLDDRH